MPAKKKQTNPKAETKPAKKKSGPKTKKSEEKQKTFPIVGLGASAGGLEALERFFRSMPKNPGMAFVIVSHLDPSRASMMPTLLQRSTDMQVLQAEDGEEVQPNHVYVIPPDRDLGIMNRRLQLLKIQHETAARAPVNYFLRHLASDQRENAVAIILSGMGTDGSQGIKAIKAEMGMVMAQDPGSAKYDGMPGSAIATGLADYILAPEKMPEALVEYEKRSILGPVPKSLPVEQIHPQGLQKILMILRSVTGHDFSSYKQSTIIRRVHRRMNIYQVDDIAKYVALIQRNPTEVKALFKELLIGVTNFFRDKEAFRALSRIFVDFLQDKPFGYGIRMWVPGCSSGEEAYSLAIVLQEAMEDLNRELNIQIFATDIDADAIEKARAGIYPGDIAADVNPELLKKYFETEDGSLRVNRKIREMVIFAVQSVIKDPPFRKLDLICCRNLLIYLNSDLQKKVLPLFHYSLNPNGILFLGSSETIGSSVDLFTPIDSKQKIFRRKPVKSPLHEVVEFPFERYPAVERPRAAGKGAEADLPSLVHKNLIEHHTPPAVIVDAKGDISYIHGRTGKYLEPAPGTTRTNNVIEMARSELKFPLSALLRTARVEKREMTHQDVEVKQNGTVFKVGIRIKPLSGAEGQELFMILFEETSSLQGADEAQAPTSPSDEGVDALEKELKYTKESLRTTIEEIETTNEELRSTNEELQSANEELNSSKEELQSLNEELETVNAELQEKNAELVRNFQEMNYLLDSMEIPTIFLDTELKVKRFTSMVTKAVSLKEMDIGRPLEDIVIKIDYPDLIRDAQEVLRTLAFKETEVQTENGRWFLVRIRPRRALSNVVDGVVITFIDINEQTRIRTELLSLRQFSDNVFNTVPEPLLVLDKDLTVISANRSFYRSFHLAPQETEGVLVYHLADKQWDMPELRKLLDDIIAKGSSFAGLEANWSFPGMGHKRMLLNARKVSTGGDSESGFILLAMEELPVGK